MGQPEPARVDRVDRHAALGADFLGTIRRGSIRRRGVSRFFVLAPAEATEAEEIFFRSSALTRERTPPHEPRRAQLLEWCCFYRQAMHCATLLTVLFLWGLLTYSVFA